MTSKRWSSLKKAIESDVDPLLKQFGYSGKGAESTEGEGFVIRYKREQEIYPTILIDVLEQPKLDYVDRVEYETWLRVYLGPTFLKTMLGGASEINPDLRAGWLYANDTEMLVCIQEIVEGLKRVLNTPSGT